MKIIFIIWLHEKDRSMYFSFVRWLRNSKNILFDPNLLVGLENLDFKYSSLIDKTDSKLSPFATPLHLKPAKMDKERTLVGVFDFETFMYRKGNVDQIRPLVFDIKIWKLGSANELLFERTLRFDIASLDVDVQEEIFNKKIIDLFDELFLFMEANRIKNLFLWAHNFSSFDSNLFYRVFPALHKNYSLDFVLKDGKMYRMTVADVKGKARKRSSPTMFFFCSLLLITGSLDKIGKSFGAPVNKAFYPHGVLRARLWGCLDISFLEIKSFLKENFSFKDRDIDRMESFWLEKECSTFIDYTVEYCKIDTAVLCFVIDKFITNFHNEFRGNYHLMYFMTASRLTYSTFLSDEAGFNKNIIISLPTNSSADEFVRSSYFGGRCEVFKGFPTLGSVYYYDFSGIYSQCIINKLPVGSPKWVVFNATLGITNLDDIQTFFSFLKDNNLCAFVKVLIETPETHIPPLGTKIFNDASSEKLLFCVGKNKNIYFSHELVMAISYGVRVLAIYEAIIYNEDYCLAEYSGFNVDKKNEATREKDDVKKSLYKLLNNSLYGKFAMKVDNSKWGVLGDGVVRIAGKTILETAALTEGFTLVKFKDSKEKWIRTKIDKTNVSVSAAISSWARIILFTRIINIYKQNPEARLMYVDTDRMFWDSDKEIVCKGMYKDLDWETQAVYKDAFFLTRKMYFVTDSFNKTTLKCKGVKTEVLTLEQFLSIRSGDKTQLHRPRNIQWMKSLKEYPATRDIAKTMSPFERTKRSYIYEDGVWTGMTEPFVNRVSNLENFSQKSNKDKLGRWEFSFSATAVEANRTLSNEDFHFFSSLDLKYYDRGVVELSDMLLEVRPLSTHANGSAFIDLELFRFSKVKNIKELFTDIYWFIYYSWKENQDMVLSVGLVLLTPTKTVTLVPSYVNDFYTYKRIGPSLFSSIVSLKIEHLNETYFERVFDLHDASSISLDVKIGIRFILLYSVKKPTRPHKLDRYDHISYKIIYESIFISLSFL